MKKAILIVAMLALMGSLLADLMTDVPRQAETFNGVRTLKLSENSSREVPEWEFVIDPVGMITNYYDYMPGSYNSTPVRLQPDNAGGGIYITFTARETASSTRRVYYAYIDGTGNILNLATIGSQDLHEGFAGIDIDPVSGDPLVAWHVNIDTSTADLEVVFTYDLFHFGSPGIWRTPFIIIEDTTPSVNAPLDEFIWPYVYVGPSPEAGKRRVYVVANNSDSTPTGSPSENVMLAFADFDETDLGIQSELDWTYTSIPEMDDWHMGIPEWKRPNGSMAVSDDGKVALFGYVITDGATSTTPDMMYAFVNDNYGEGDFTMYEGQAEFDIWNPQNQDGTYAFVDENNLPHQLYMEPYLCNHQNVIFANNNTQLKFMGNMNLMLRPASWYPGIPFMYPKIYTFDLVTEEFSFQDIFLTGANPNDNIPMIPWDLDEDGQVDEYDPDGYVMWEDGWPIYHFDPDVGFHENTYKMTQNEENGWLAAVWHDGLKARYGNEPVAGWEPWAEYPELCIAISSDGGENWQDTIVMNAKSDDENFVAEFADMIPVYSYPGDKIEDLGDGWGLLHLFFLDDNSYGSSIQSWGQNLGGTQMYTAIKIYFGSDSGNDNNAVTPALASIAQNYPNPFNPETTIKYNLSEASDVQIEVYNVKGQRITTLVDDHKAAGTHSVVWNGTDSMNRSVSSGVYFYNLKAGGRYTNTKKMILLK